ncbi:hypothetical protein T484DRAFT_1797006 [Baffinella frigidus]|nr:hypothetical protein T484DRAFT_1797006 [Cryptophyta sp. CCMP2293]
MDKSKATTGRDCHFDIDKSKAHTGRSVVFREFGIVHSYTLEASVCGTERPGTLPIPDGAHGALGGC